MESGRSREVLDKACTHTGTHTFCCMLEGLSPLVHSVEGQNLYDTIYDALYCISKHLIGLDCSTVESMCTLARVCVSMYECA